MTGPQTTPIMTAYAQAALAVSDLVVAKFAALRFSGKVARVVRVQPPQGPSTGGGKNARESVVLFPENGDSAQALTVGFIDLGLHAVELRTYDALASAYALRHKRKLDLPMHEYEQFVRELHDYLSGAGYAFKTIDADAIEAKASAAAGRLSGGTSFGGRVPWRTVIPFVVAVVVAVLVVVVVTLVAGRGLPS
jgi:hypothetical protein